VPTQLNVAMNMNKEVLPSRGVTWIGLYMSRGTGCICHVNRVVYVTWIGLYMSRE